MNIRFFKAFNGDSIHISFVDDSNIKRNILIDGGTKATYKVEKGKKNKPEYGELKSLIDKIKASGEFIDLLIITHIDDDHIGGVLKWFGEDKCAHEIIKEVWFNSGSLIAEKLEQMENIDIKTHFTRRDTNDTNIAQGIEFGAYIKSKGIWKDKLFLQNDNFCKFGLRFRFLSPNIDELKKFLKEWKKIDPNTDTSPKKDDYSLSIRDHITNDDDHVDKKDDEKGIDKDSSIGNGSSLAFIISDKSENFLFLGDAFSSVIEKGLSRFGYSIDNPISARLVKLPHHGSKRNLFYSLLKCIKSDNFVVSTNGAYHKHPDKQLLSRIININRECNLYFNYKERMNMIFFDQDKIDFPNFSIIYLDDEFKI